MSLGKDAIACIGERLVLSNILASTRTERLLCVLAGLSLFLTGCHKSKPPPPAPPVVQVLTIHPSQVPVYQEWLGSLEGYVNAQIRAQVTGYLLSQNYQEGANVQKGDLLFQIDPRPFEATLAQAKAKLAQSEAAESRARWDEERYAPLARQRAVSEQEYENAVQTHLAAQAQVRADQAAVQTAELGLGFTRIIAPIDGIAGVAQAQIGDLVGPSGPLLTTVSTVDPIKVYFTASEQVYLAYQRQYATRNERAAHEQGLQLQLILSDGSTYNRPGKFLFAGREVNPTTGTIQLVGEFPNPDHILRPGQFARVKAQTQTLNDAVVVPQRAVSELQGSYQVAVVDAQNRAHLQPVTVGEQIGSNWLIEKGLRPGERIIVEGLQKVKEGTAVRAEPFVAKEKSNVALSP